MICLVQAATIFALVASYYTYFYFEWARKGEQGIFHVYSFIFILIQITV